MSVGYTLDEIRNDITESLLHPLTPMIDYVVVKIPRFAFEKFPQADQTLTTQMKSVGEVMSIGRTFKEALQKAIRSLEIDRYGFSEVAAKQSEVRGQESEVKESMDNIRERLKTLIGKGCGTLRTLSDTE